MLKRARRREVVLGINIVEGIQKAVKDVEIMRFFMKDFKVSSSVEKAYSVDIGIKYGFAFNGKKLLEKLVTAVDGVNICVGVNHDGLIKKKSNPKSRLFKSVA